MCVLTHCTLNASIHLLCINLPNAFICSKHVHTAFEDAQVRTTKGKQIQKYSSSLLKYIHPYIVYGVWKNIMMARTIWVILCNLNSQFIISALPWRDQADVELVITKLIFSSAFVFGVVRIQSWFYVQLRFPGVKLSLIWRLSILHFWKEKKLYDLV